MLSSIRIVAFAFLLVGLVACGKTSEQKAQDHAKNLTEEQNRLSDYFNKTYPDVSWTDQQLNDYGAKLDRLEQVDAELKGMSGSNGVHIVSGDNSQAITARRIELDSVREAKASGNKVQSSSTFDDKDTLN